MASLLALADAELEVEPDDPEEDDWEGAGVVLELLEPGPLVELVNADEPVDAAEPLVAIEPVGEAAPLGAITLANPT